MIAFYRIACLLGTLTLMLAPSFAEAQSTYPNKPILMIVPLAAGSAVDAAARIVAQRMSANMGQQVIIENQPGAAGLIGTERVARAVPDGYTIGGFNDSIMTMLPNLYSNLTWNILKDFEPVSLVATVEWGLVASNTAPYKSAGDLIAAARANPGNRELAARPSPRAGGVRTHHIEPGAVSSGLMNLGAMFCDAQTTPIADPNAAV